jgi:hypothetical protein
LEIMSKHKLPLCSGTNCMKRAIGVNQELIPVPTWRHPADRPMQGVLEVAKTVFYCAEHEKEATSVQYAILSL